MRRGEGGLEVEELPPSHKMRGRADARTQLCQSVVFTAAPACFHLLENHGIFQRETGLKMVKMQFCSEESRSLAFRPLGPGASDSQPHLMWTSRVILDGAPILLCPSLFFCQVK